MTARSRAEVMLRVGGLGVLPAYDGGKGCRVSAV